MYGQAKLESKNSSMVTKAIRINLHRHQINHRLEHVLADLNSTAGYQKKLCQYMNLGF